MIICYASKKVSLVNRSSTNVMYSAQSGRVFLHGSNQNFPLERNDLTWSRLCIQKSSMQGIKQGKQEVKQRRLMGGWEKPSLSWRKSGRAFLSVNPTGEGWRPAEDGLDSIQ